MTFLNTPQEYVLKNKDLGKASDFFKDKLELLAQNIQKNNPEIQLLLEHSKKFWFSSNITIYYNEEFVSEIQVGTVCNDEEWIPSQIVYIQQMQWKDVRKDVLRVIKDEIEVHRRDASKELEDLITAIHQYNYLITSCPTELQDLLPTALVITKSKMQEKLRKLNREFKSHELCEHEDGCFHLYDKYSKQVF